MAKNCIDKRDQFIQILATCGFEPVDNVPKAQGHFDIGCDIVLCICLSPKKIFYPEPSY